MAVEYMVPINIKRYQGFLNTSKGFEYKGPEIVATGNGNPILIPTQVQYISVALIVTTGSGKIQTTVSTKADVEADNALWFDWSAGVVSENTADVARPVTAIRQVNITGKTQLFMRAQ